MNAYELIMTRRSTRRFSEKPVEEEKLGKMIDAGRYAPSGGNSQTTHFFVITDQRLLDELAETVQSCFAGMEITEGMYGSLVSSITQSKNGNYRFHYDCPVLIVTANQKDYGNNIADCACALENMMILGNELDLGTCWINQLRWLNEEPAVLDIFRKYGLEENERIYGALAVGYPLAGEPERTPLPRKGNPVTRI